MNTIKLVGTVKGKPEYSHKVLGEKFYSFTLEVKRKSGTVDSLVCVAPELLINNIEENSRIEINGEIRTRSVEDENGKKHLSLSVFCNSIEVTDEDYDANEVEVVGFTCKKATLRETPNGREVSECLIASNRERVSHKSDYIPFIAWGRNAHRLYETNVGQKLNLTGRLQSRVYKKTLENRLEEYKTTYELSVSSLVESEE